MEFYRVSAAFGSHRLDLHIPGRLDQRHLLEEEGVAFDSHGRVDLERFGWDPDAVPRGRLKAGRAKGPISEVRAIEAILRPLGTPERAAGAKSIKMAISINTLPNNVYRKNLIAAYSFRGPPQTPMRKYIGRSMTSQNT